MKNLEEFTFEFVFVDGSNYTLVIQNCEPDYGNKILKQMESNDSDFIVILGEYFQKSQIRRLKVTC